MKDIIRPSLTVVVPIADRDLRPAESKCISLVEDASTLTLSTTRDSRIPTNHGNLLSFLRRLSTSLQGTGAVVVAGALEEAIQQCIAETDFGGYGLNEQETLHTSQEADVIFLCSAFLEALKSAARAGSKPQLLSQRPKGRRGMTMAEKIFAMHDVSRRGYVKPGDIIQVEVDWVLASELSWQGMETVYDSVGRPGIFRNDRFWLAGDHRVEPPLYDQPKVKNLMDTSLRAKQDFKMTDFQGFNVRANTCF
ncbi:hypothetical protein LTR10_014897 [Elasticomyces elasticus]|uniref:Uncharacterized protein n=1 Tax=Exophiala sideris TaxID=1016849 RepID=A0ABR0JFP6_9EURO|nr:hypothetical protein LTR10_014897 [Elasticomyces elasticus]KAK5025741.1 hypothetical protein LTS07_007945 [Exophiala sideris]KAK5033051.1 hypothetical protein LTR13_007016 [Exophiala sideris]KAK5063536.1 hypothetical protein LTR69_004242 [Exophiala sideris]KAK5180632.1 hypothetical protein LTR44_006946 [Eurotiomycetes sp. CCFEE 6388]